MMHYLLLHGFKRSMQCFCMCLCVATWVTPLRCMDDGAEQHLPAATCGAFYATFCSTSCTLYSACCVVRCSVISVFHFHVDPQDSLAPGLLPMCLRWVVTMCGCGKAERVRRGLRSRAALCGHGAGADRSRAFQVVRQHDEWQ